MVLSLLPQGLFVFGDKQLVLFKVSPLLLLLLFITNGTAFLTVLDKTKLLFILLIPKKLMEKCQMKMFFLHFFFFFKVCFKFARLAGIRWENYYFSCVPNLPCLDGKAHLTIPLTAAAQFICRCFPGYLVRFA